MWNTAWTEDGISCMKLYAAVANLKEDFAFQDAEPLFLVQVKMKRRAAFYQVVMFNDEEAAACLARSNFEENGAETARVGFSEPVLPGRHHVNLFSGRGRGKLGDCEGRKSRAGEDCRCEFEEGTTLHRFSDCEESTGSYVIERY